jgi:glutathione S-transferase
MTTVTRQDRGMRPIAEPLAERFAQVLWADDEEQRQRADLQLMLTLTRSTRTWRVSNTSAATHGKRPKTLRRRDQGPHRRHRARRVQAR